MHSHEGENFGLWAKVLWTNAPPKNASYPDLVSQESGIPAEQ